MRFPQAPPSGVAEIIGRWVQDNAGLLLTASPELPDGRYLAWEELRPRPTPEGISAEEWWAIIKLARLKAASPVAAMSAVYPVSFSFVLTPKIQRELHAFDHKNVGQELLSALGDEGAVTEYRARQLIEEAISSSEIEGARPTTRELARQMVREQRAPVSRDERMIFNNWRAMQRVLELHAEKRALALDDLLELHRILGDDALEVPDAAGRFRGPEHDVRVMDLEGTVWHTPPDARGLNERVEALLRFAAGVSDDGNAFIHPVVRAIIVHFWMGYEHPFRDGNGRIARALYYWCMLRGGYEIAEFLSISGPIDRSPKAYYLAFAHTEIDGGDLTYFVLHQLGIMHEALAELIAHLKDRAERMRVLARTVAGFDELNHRQRAILQHAIRHPLESYTIEGHASSHRVHYQTARSDLADLVSRSYFELQRVGKGKRFRPTKAFAKKLKR